MSFKMSVSFSSASLLKCLLLFIIGLQTISVAVVGVNAATIPSKPALTIRIQQCREGCLEKFSTQQTLCSENPECSTCWEECAKPTVAKMTKTILETWSLKTVSMLQQDSLVLVDVAWEPQLNTPNQCLVTWEVSGGGLMGNLLTETYSVQLSLWPDTKYRVQVTCKNKNTGSMSRSLPLNIDTSEAITTHIPMRTTNKQLPAAKLLPTTTESSLMANLPFATSSSSPSVPISAPIPTFMDHPLASFENGDDDDVVPINDQQTFNNDLARLKPHHQHTGHQHSNYLFDWHRGTVINSAASDDLNAGHTDVQVDKLIPVNQSDLNLITIATLSDVQRPLLFGVIAGILLLTFVLAMYICALRSQRVPSDKAALIEDDGCSSLDNHNNICNSNSCVDGGRIGCNGIVNIQHATSQCDEAASGACAAANHFGTGPSNILNPNYYSRSVHVLTV